MVLRGGVVKEAVAIPPLEPSPERVPVTEAHRKGVVDPMSAAIMPVAGKGDAARAGSLQAQARDLRRAPARSTSTSSTSAWTR